MGWKLNSLHDNCWWCGWQNNVLLEKVDNYWMHFSAYNVWVKIIEAVVTIKSALFKKTAWIKRTNKHTLKPTGGCTCACSQTQLK